MPTPMAGRGNPPRAAAAAAITSAGGREGANPATGLLRPEVCAPPGGSTGLTEPPAPAESSLRPAATPSLPRFGLLAQFTNIFRPLIDV